MKTFLLNENNARIPIIILTKSTTQSAPEIIDFSSEILKAIGSAAEAKKYAILSVTETYIAGSSKGTTTTKHSPAQSTDAAFNYPTAELRWDPSNNLTAEVRVTNSGGNTSATLMLIKVE